MGSREKGAYMVLEVGEPGLCVPQALEEAQARAEREKAAALKAAEEKWKREQAQDVASDVVLRLCCDGRHSSERPIGRSVYRRGALNGLPTLPSSRRSTG